MSGALRIGFLAASASLLITGPVLAERAMFKDLVGKKALEIRAKKKHVFNADKAPKLRDLRGQVVWLEFGFIH